MKKKIALLCTLVFALHLFPVSAFAVSETENTLSLFPPAITQQMIDQNGLVKRLSGFDNELNAIGYENADGTETVFIFGEDVKYIDDNGNVRDKDVSIVETSAFKKLSGYEYETKSNDVKVSFAKEMSSSKGLKLEYDGYAVTLAPIIQTASNKITATLMTTDSKKITYQNAIDQNTHIRFETTFSGIKEDIILDKYTGKNEFSFVLNTGGLIPKAENGGVTLSSKDEVVMEIPPAYVIDSNGNSTVNNDIELTLINGNLYTLTVVVDNAFLTSQDTVYPVYIDPSVFIGNSYIEDATVYQNMSGDNYGASQYLGIGDNGYSGVSFTYMKFDISPLVNAGITYDEVLGAFFAARVISNPYTNAVAVCHQVTQAWSESTIKYNGMPTWSIEQLTSMNAKVEPNDEGVFAESCYWLNFYITTAVMSWLQGVPNYGVMIRERTYSSPKEFASSEHPLYLPYMSVCYQSQYAPEETTGIATDTYYYIKNKKTGLYMTNGANANGTSVIAGVDTSAFTGNSNQKWKFSHKGNGEYTIIPEIDTDLRLASIGTFGGLSLNLNLAEEASGYQRWYIRRNYNGTYSFFTMAVLSGNMTFGVQYMGAFDTSPTLCDYAADYNLKDEWTLEQVSIGTTNFFSFTNNGAYGIDTTGYISSVVNNLINMGYSGSNNVNTHASTGYDLMDESGLWYFRGHASGNTMWFNSPSLQYGWEESILVALPIISDYSLCSINSYSHNALNKLQLATFGGCSSGTTDEDYHSNTVGIVYLKGANVTIGFTETTYVSTSSQWMQQFVNRLIYGATILEAMEGADSVLYSDENVSDCGNTNQRHILGDTSKVLFHNFLMQ